MERGILIGHRVPFLNLIAYFVIHSLSTKKELQNTVDTYIKNKEETK